jgi:sugar (pentulose or hexulose) kinase
MREKPFLAVDLGAASGRAVLGTFEGGRLTISHVHRFENRPVRLGGSVYWDFLFLWSNVIESLALCASRGAVELAAIGIDSWNLDFALVDKAGKLLANPLSYRDESAGWAGGRIASVVDELELYRETGIPNFPITGLARLIQMRRGGYAKLLDLARWYLPIPDLVRFYLTGGASIEETIAWGTQLVNVARRKWSRKLIELFDIPKRIFPGLVPSGGNSTPLSRETAEITGLRPCTVIPVAEHDTMSAVFTAHHLDPEAAILSAGTWSVFGSVIDAPLVSLEAMDKGFLDEIAYRSIFLGKNLMGFFLLEEFLKCWRAKGIECDYDSVAHLASSAPPGSFHLDPNDPLFFSPSNLEAAFREYCEKTDQEPPASPCAGSLRPGVSNGRVSPGKVSSGKGFQKGEIGVITRALYEGLASSYARALEDLNELLHKRFASIVMVGGGVRNGLFCQLVADACRAKVVAGPAEATAVGNLCVQALAVERIRAEDMGDLLEASFEVMTYYPCGD